MGNNAYLSRLMSYIYNLDLNLLKSLQALIQEQHVSHAAAKLNVSQPAMSQALQKLRTHFEDPLLVRVGNEMELTSRAKEISQSLSVIFDELEALHTSHEFHPDLAKGTFRIDTHEYVAASFLAEPIRRIRLLAPKLNFNFVMCSPESFRDLDAGLSDMVIANERRASLNFRRRPVFEEPIFCVLDEEHPAIDNLTVENLFEYPHSRMSYSDSYCDQLDKYARDNGLVRDIVTTTDNLQLQVPFIEGTRQIAFLPETLAFQSVRHRPLKAIPCPVELLKVRTSMMWNELKHRDPVHKWVRQLLCDETQKNWKSEAS